MKFLKNGDQWLAAPASRLDIRDELPVGVYTFCKNALSGEYYLEESAGFSLPSKFYGKVEKFSNHILNTFSRRKENDQVGVLLSGTKGSGKTLLAKLISKNSGLPTIIINAPFCDDRFMRMVQSISQPAVIVIDEFEKLYDSEAQAKILTLFDGVYTAHNKLMIVTCNNLFEVASWFQNRPSRIRYSINFGAVDGDFITEYCRDQLVEFEKYVDKIIYHSTVCSDFNFDMLQILVNELNTHGGEFDDVIEILNVKPIFSMQSKLWNMKFFSNKKKVAIWGSDTTKVSPMNHLANGYELEVSFQEVIEDGENDDSEGDDEKNEIHDISFGFDDVTSIDPTTSSVTFQKQVEDELYTLIYTESKKKKPSVSNLKKIVS